MLSSRTIPVRASAGGERLIASARVIDWRGFTPSRSLIGAVATMAGTLATEKAVTLFGAGEDAYRRSQWGELLNNSKTVQEFSTMQNLISNCCGSALPWWCD